ncbi:peptidase M50 family protein [Clostridium argentinense CDC 2741]|uniref:Peptidase M50 family protein n=1 Tax=Clostridium argentinense CDC 2741 TaxID=1418104 RepID=A0A0C1R1H6_9CLOT|nr:M50 family metallopeptidase [Clostridium argentinense]ARC85570.1 metalloprotease [Clostridium argentinense]KIE47247.1 peptidase M50 family protein [Clostridium argentinense CDC 2741]NFF40085.1 metalloprotease [Clostridium argentinense]NFP50215.1 metalloprotease [Clostridium argentinense]NFP71856.1 metalloprotease [Clostridium argentinense]
MIRFSKYFIPYLLFLIIIGINYKLLLGFIIVIIHEMIHYITARILGYSGFCIEILPIGAALKLKDLDEASPMEDIIISLSGPIGNFIIALISYVVYKYINNSYILLFLQYNMAIGLFNLFPAFPLDGGRVLRDILTTKFLYKKANEIALRISIILGYILLIIHFITLLYGISNINLALIAIFILVISKKEKERIVYVIMGYIIKKREKLIKRGYIENKSISVHYKLTLLQLLDLVDKNKYNIFTVLDDNMDVLEVIYEEEVINGLKNQGNMTLEQFIINRDFAIYREPST